jgi:integrase
MIRHPAKVLEPADLCRVLKHVKHTRHPLRNQVMVLLSFKAGLRACEIAGLDWRMVLRTTGKVGHVMRIGKHIAKGQSSRSIPMHKTLAKRLRALHKDAGHPLTGPVIRSERGGPMSASSIVNWFHGIYYDLGLKGCSSHSGRRTFITNAARALMQTGGSLRDIQELAGHRALTTTERYIEGDRAVQHKLVSLV